MAVPTDNISIREYNQISKYKDVEREIKKMWHLQTITAPEIVRKG